MKYEMIRKTNRVTLPRHHHTRPQLERVARTATENKRAVLTSKLKMQAGDLHVICTYLGVKVNKDELDVDKVVSGNDVLRFQWVLRTEKWEWVVPVSIFTRNLHHGPPLPQCVVTKQRLIDVAEHAKTENSPKDVCVFPVLTKGL